MLSALSANCDEVEAPLGGKLFRSLDGLVHVPIERTRAFRVSRLSVVEISLLGTGVITMHNDRYMALGR